MITYKGKTLRPWVGITLGSIVGFLVGWALVALLKDAYQVSVVRKMEQCNDVGSLFGYEEVKYLHGQCYGLLDGKAVIVL